MPANQDPYERCNFLVEIDGVAAGGFTAVSGLAVAVEVVEHRTGDRPSSARKGPGRTTYEAVTLERGVTQDLAFWSWQNEIAAGRVDRRSVSIVLLDGERNPVLRWTLRNAWPCRWEGPTLDASDDCVAIETLELAYEGLELETA